jgi:D-alanine-D-alanine ligase
MIAVVHNAVSDNSLPDEQDVLVQVKSVSAALEQLGYRPVAIPCDLNLERLKSDLNTLTPRAAFNLVESLDGHGRLIQVVPALLAALGIAYAGCPAEAIYATSHKIMAKERMRAAGLSTADWINPVPMDIPWAGAARLAEKKRSFPPVKLWIIKSLWEHASLGLEQENLVTASVEEMASLLKHRARDLGGACFAEAFIDGREFNLSLLETDAGVKVLPPAEILFHGFNPHSPKIVGYRAKWISDSMEYNNTPRSFDFLAADQHLLERLETIALECWHLFGLKGYARVDFRVDKTNTPFVLEINANPCISPDAGFVAALDRAGIEFTQAVDAILNHSNQPATVNKSEAHV